MRRDDYGEDVEKERYEQATDKQQYMFEVCWEMWDPRSVIPMEFGEWYSSELQEDKDIHTVLDCSGGIDYLVDPFTEPIFGLNHRVHSPTDKTLNFDLRLENGNGSRSEAETLLSSMELGDIAPKYATRLKKSETGVEWCRIVYLEPLIQAIRDTCFQPIEYDDDDYVAWYTDYGVLDSMGCWVAEFDGDGEKVFAESEHESLGVDDYQKRAEEESEWSK